MLFYLFSSHSDAEAGTEIDGQRGVAHDFVVAAIQGVLDIDKSGEPRMDRIPSAYIGANVSGGVIDVETQKIGVGAASHETSGEFPPHRDPR